MRFAWTFLLLSCGGAAPRSSATQWDAADAIFHADPRWLGADAAYSIDLGGDRTAWFFGDTLVAKTAANVRTESTMVRNSVAVQTGRDPTKATIAFAWKTATDGSPASFIPENAGAWHWPGHGVRIPSGPLIVFLSVVKQTGSAGMFGFTYDGWRIAIVDDPDKAPADWSVRFIDGPKPSFDAVPGAAVVRKPDGFIYAMAPQFQGSHDAFLARFEEKSLLAGTLTPEWWTGDAWSASASPKVVIEAAGTEFSVHLDARISKWVHVTSHGFGASTIAVRFADRLEGPWTQQIDVYTPPESKSEKPFVYAAKAHPELATGSDDLAVTYATNSFDFATLFKPEGSALYWPRFVRISLAAP